jgi:hypothetical protein
VIIMFTMYTVVFVTIVALAVNVYLIGNALMQQRNAVEYVAMSVLKVANEPAIPFDAATCLQNELAYLNCVLKRAEVAGMVKIGSSTESFYVVPGSLKVIPRSGEKSCCTRDPNSLKPCDDDPGGPDDSGPDGSDGSGGSGGGGGEDDDDAHASDDDFCWDSYQIEQDEYAELVMGRYSVQADGQGSFTDAATNEVKQGNFNAVKLRFHFNPTDENTKMIAPLIGIFGKDMKLKFSSSALAYRTPGGSIQLAIDPTLSM